VLASIPKTQPCRMQSREKADNYASVTQGVPQSFPVSFAAGGNQMFNNKGQHAYTYRVDGSGTIYWDGYNWSITGGSITSLNGN